MLPLQPHLRKCGCFDSLAQLVEQLTLNQWVEGSSPSGVTKRQERKMKIHTLLSVYLFYFQLFAYVFMAATDCFALRHCLIAHGAAHVHRQSVQKGKRPEHNRVHERAYRG